MFNRFKKGIILVLIISVFFPVGVKASDIEYDKRYEVTLSKCVDGDTAKFSFPDGEIYSTRFLAIDTPESVHPTKKAEAYGKEASEYTCNKLTNAKKIELEYDRNSDWKDRYDRLLAWVFVDDELLQVNLIKEGLAEVAYLYGDYKYVQLLKDEEVTAKALKRGKWSNEIKTVPDEKEEKKSTKKTSSKKKNDSWINELIDYTLGKIFDYFNKLIEKIVESIESML